MAGWWAWGVSNSIRMSDYGVAPSKSIPSVYPYAVKGISVRKDLTLKDVRNWLRALSKRLLRVGVLNKSWEAAVTPGVLGLIDSKSVLTRKKIAVFLDPPYLGHSDVYEASRAKGRTDQVNITEDSYIWAVENGRNPKFRIAYSCFKGDFPVPKGWVVVESQRRSMRGSRKRTTTKVDQIMFSPHCLNASSGLFN